MNPSGYIYIYIFTFLLLDSREKKEPISEGFGCRRPAEALSLEASLERRLQKFQGLRQKAIQRAKASIEALWVEGLGESKKDGENKKIFQKNINNSKMVW